MTVTEKYQAVSRKIAALSGGKAELLCVIKYASDEQVLELLAQGLITHAGESRLQAASRRWQDLRFTQYRQNVKLHFLGHLQKNKIAKITALFDYIASVDSVENALLISRAAAALNKKQNIFAQIKLTDKAAQGGVSLGEAGAFITRLKSIENLNVRGLMAIAPMAGPEVLVPLFKRVKTVFDANFAAGNYLSLGMSLDYEAALAQGANLPRIGSAIFEEDAQ